MCQEIEQFMAPLTAGAVQSLERALGDDGLTAMQACAFERLRHELVLDVVPSPLTATLLSLETQARHIDSGRKTPSTSNSSRS